MGKCIDLTGRRFGKLVVLKRERNDKFKYANWLCKCECGNVKKIRGRDLIHNFTKSCGCYRKEINITHNGRYDRLYDIWCCMKARCYNMKNNQYDNYGKRGITVCEEWINDYQTFKDWAYSNGYDDNLTIDRIDVNGNYEPNNCRWVSQKVQQNNRRNNRIITYKEETHTLTEWCEITGLSINTIRHRMERGWDIEKTLTTPQRKRKERSIVD